MNMKEKKSVSFASDDSLEHVSRFSNEDGKHVWWEVLRCPVQDICGVVTNEEDMREFVASMFMLELAHCLDE